MKKSIIILCGIPCSGKSTWAKIEQNGNVIYPPDDDISIICRDTIRENLYGRKYKHNSEREKRVTQEFDTLLHRRINDSYTTNIILDNTHCKESYLDSIINRYKGDHNINIKFFDISIRLAYWRNITRYITTGKWIPIKVINQMYKNYNGINREKYREYNI